MEHVATGSTFYGTSVGKKVVMAVTGFVVFGFVLVHMVGNLQLFAGPEKLNAYAQFLQGLGGLLWAFRAVLLVCAVLHVVAATQVTLQSWAARPEGYAVQRYRETTYAARTMRVGGPIILLFLLYHILHFTTGQAHPQFDPGEVYNNVVRGFQVWWSSAIYIVANVFVALHLYHGVYSMLQTVGVAHPKWNRWRRALAVLFGLALGIGNVSLPVAVLAGVVKPV